MKHASYLPENKTLCGLPLPQSVGWGFVELGMRLRKGQQYSLFEESVDCPQCLEVSKTLVDDVCSCCGSIKHE
jgi:hypothetical protein